MRRLPIVSIALLVVVCPPASAQIPTIDDPVTTEFGVYRPNPVSVNPTARQFTVAPGLANVENADRFTLTAGQVRRLEEDGFFVTLGAEPLYADSLNLGTAYRNFEDVYLETQGHQIPSLVTTDTMLHVYHRIFDHTLMQTEEQYLLPALEQLDARVLQRLSDVRDAATDAAVRDAARLAAAYTAVAVKLLDPDADVPGWTEPELSQELALIEAHDCITLAPLFTAFLEDYTQYIPRGHYTRSQALERYFRAMMWHGRMAFVLKDRDGIERPDITAAALLLTRELLADDGDPTLPALWTTVFHPTELFVGESDDPLPGDYATLAESVYGSPLTELDAEAICDPDHLDELISRGDELPQPRIRGITPPGLRVFGQRFIPDSWYFSSLVFDDVGPNGEGQLRLMPTVLDILAVLGSAEAEDLLESSGAFEFQGYGSQLAMLRDDVTGGPSERWASTLYWGWMYGLAPLLETWGPGYPPFMQHDLWPRRQLMAAHGSWTELRHDTILYAKQSYSEYTSEPPVMPFVQGYVEPNPWVFARLNALARYTREGLAGLDILDETVEEKLQSLEDATALLADAAVRELERRPLSDDQYRFVYELGEWLQAILAPEDGGGDMADDDDRAPLVADVHTDPNTQTALEEGTNYPGRLLLVADVEGRLQLCVGAVFVPHEFSWPINDRLTDEAWWDMLEDGGPDVPWWAAPAVDVPSPPPAQPFGGPQGCYEPSSAMVTLTDTTVPVGEPLEITCSPQPVRIQLRPADAEPVTIDDPGAAAEPIALSTAHLPPGECIVVAELADGTSYAVRTRLTHPVSVGGTIPEPRRSGVRP